MYWGGYYGTSLDIEDDPQRRRLAAPSPTLLFNDWKNAVWGIGLNPEDSERRAMISAEYSERGARLSKTVWRLTYALQTWWRFCGDDCAMTQRRVFRCVVLVA